MTLSNRLIVLLLPALAIEIAIAIGLGVKPLAVSVAPPDPPVLNVDILCVMQASDVVADPPDDDKDDALPASAVITWRPQCMSIPRDTVVQ